METLKITDQISSAAIAEMAFNSLVKNSSQLRELLLVSKNEQTFSGLLSQDLHQLASVAPGAVLLELKGNDYVTKVRGERKNSRNYHDLTIVNDEAEIEVIIENKFWYHFDGAKGVTKVKPERRIRQQIEEDIYKIHLTLDKKSGVRRGFILINVVTPRNPEMIPPSYFKEHAKVWKRTKQDIVRYRKEGLEGIKGVLEEFKSDYKDLIIKSSTTEIAEGFLDVICAEVLLP